MNMSQRIAVIVVLLVGLATAFVLLRSGASKMVVDAPMPPRALYLLWAAFATVWIAIAAAWFVSPLCSRPRRSLHAGIALRRGSGRLRGQAPQ